MNYDALEQSSQAARVSAVTWLAGRTELIRSGSDATPAVSALFGIHCAARALPASSEVVFAATRSLTADVSKLWNAAPYEFYGQFVSGGFVSAMMGAIAAASGESGNSMRTLCGNAWQAVEARAVFRDSPTLLWTGRRLFAAMNGGTADLLAPVWWRSEISAMTAPHQISVPAIKQIVADLAAMSGYGAFEPPLPNTEREYLRDLLPFLTFYYAKERDLELVNLLLKGLRYAHLADVPEFGDAVRFVLGRQRTDGRFTMRDLATHLQALSDEPPLDIERTIHLPLTIGSIWALSESLSGTGPLACREREVAAA